MDSDVRSIVVVLAVTVVTMGCQKRSQTSDDRMAAKTSEETRDEADDLPRARSGDDLADLDGQRVAIVGTYEQVDVRKQKGARDVEPVYRGHVVVRLEEGRTVYLEPIWSDEAIRPDAEIEQFEGESVRVVGKLHERCPPPDEPMATIVAPCLHPVESVRAR